MSEDTLHVTELFSSTLSEFRSDPAPRRTGRRRRRTARDGQANGHRLRSAVWRRLPAAKGSTSDRSIRSVAKQDSVLEIDHFNLWYGAKQALFNIIMRSHAAR